MVVAAQVQEVHGHQPARPVLAPRLVLPERDPQRLTRQPGLLPAALLLRGILPLAQIARVHRPVTHERAPDRLRREHQTTARMVGLIAARAAEVTAIAGRPAAPTVVVGAGAAAAVVVVVVVVVAVNVQEWI